MQTTDILTNFPDEEFLFADGFDDAVLGVDEISYRVIYSMTKCIDILKRSGMSDEDAVEYFYYNTIGSYVGERTPIWCNDLMF
jgi:hypothetical protein